MLTDLSAECENLPIEGVSGACYAHKVNVRFNAALSACLLQTFTPVSHRRFCHCYSKLLVFQKISESVSLNAGHMPGGGLYLQEVGQRWHPEPGFLHCSGKKCNQGQKQHFSRCRHLFISVTSLPIYKRNKLLIMQFSLITASQTCMSLMADFPWLSFFFVLIFYYISSSAGLLLNCDIVGLYLLCCGMYLLSIYCQYKCCRGNRS